MRERRELDRDGDLEPIAVVDIGSNSVRLVVYEGLVRSPTTTFNEKVLCGLGRQVASTGFLGKEAVERALNALRRFKAITNLLGVKSICAIATAACRDAKDGPDFIARGEQALGVSIQVLSGEREAALAANGILMGFRNPDGIAGDLGGGSLELIDVGGEKLREAVTLPLGGLRLIDVAGDRMDKALDVTDAFISKVPWLAAGRGRDFFAVGGTWRSIARMHMEVSDYPLRVMHGYTLPTREAIAFCEEIRRAKKISAMKGITDVARPRREVLPFGALVLERLLKQLQPARVHFSVFGIREGLLYGMLPAAERRKDPLLSFCQEYAQLRSRSAEHGAELSKWTDALFDGPGPKESPDEKRLRHAACLISDISWRSHPDYRGEQSLILIAHGALAGVDHQDRVFLALSVYFRHAGGGGEGEAGDRLPDRLKSLISKRQYKRARIVGAAIRTAHMISIGQAGIIDEAPLSYEGNRLVLTLPPAYAALDGERLRRRFGALAELVDCQPELRVKR
jgi:exopolyphosphatase/guanosine-5'-triphosphate,3'-diphosphate pyrophosphatase